MFQENIFVRDKAANKEGVALQIKFLLFLVLFVHFSKSTEYVYPVSQIDDESYFYVCQKSLTDLELWRHYIKGDRREKCLYWRFIPAGLKVLCDKSGFSFVDSGRLRIKKFKKRSPRSIDFDTPVYGVGEVSWLSNDTCYFSAKQKDNFAIFYGDIKSGNVYCAQQVNGAECLCPNIIDGQLFYVERNATDRASGIVVLPAPQFGQSQIKDLRKLILDCDYKQVIYLKMISSKLGFYLEHMPYINDKQKTITFICYKIEQQENSENWISQKIFKFQVLKKYLFGDDRLYESLVPFFPTAKKTTIYFADIKQNQSGEYNSSPFTYDLISNKITPLAHTLPNGRFFAPLKIKDRVICGKILEEKLKSDKLIPISINSGTTT